MKDTELTALISLLEDPDDSIYTAIEHKLITCGPTVVPALEKSWEQAEEGLLQTRIEQVIHKIQFDQIKNDIQLWKLNNPEDLLEGLLIINRYHYASLDEGAIHIQFAEMRRQVWYELIYEMSPLEKVKLLNNMIFNEMGFSGNTAHYHAPENSFIHHVLSSKKGNPISLACIYSLIAQKLDIPIYGINLPKHFMLAYMDPEQPESKVLFYINVFNRGQVMMSTDIHAFLKQLDVPITDAYTLPCDNVAIVRRMLRNLIAAYEHSNQEEKKKEIQSLLYLMDA